MKVALWSMFICAQYLLRISIHDFLMLKETKRFCTLSYWKQPDLIIRFIFAFLAFYYALFMYLKFDIALSVTCTIFFNLLFYKIYKSGPTQKDLLDAQRIIKYKEYKSYKKDIMSIDFSNKVSILGFMLGMGRKEVISKLEALGSPYIKDTGQIPGDITYKIQNPIENIGLRKFYLQFELAKGEFISTLMLCYYGKSEFDSKQAYEELSMAAYNALQGQKSQIVDVPNTNIDEERMFYMTENYFLMKRRMKVFPYLVFLSFSDINELPRFHN